MPRPTPAIPFVLLLICFLQAHGQEAANLARKLDRLPKPWTGKLHRLTAPEYKATLRHWQAKHPQFLTLESAGRSREDDNLHLLKITDPKVDDADKQIALITALHGGPERSGTTTAMHLIEWLLGDDPEAIETRRRQIVLLIPIINPYAYFKTDRFGTSVGIDPYTGGGPQNWDLKNLTYKAAKEVPEVKAFLDVVDRFRPEVHLDLHGTGLQEYSVEQLGDRQRYAGQTMIEITGSAYSNYALRPWDWRVTEAMIAAGDAAGYPSDRFEADAQRAYWGPAMNAVTQFTWRGRPNFYTAQYAYAKYHTMIAALEVGWEKSGLARTKGLLRIGNNTWPTRNQPGYPVDRLRTFIGHYVTAYGKTAAQRQQVHGRESAIQRPHDRKSPGIPIENGIGFHLRIPYRNPKLVDVRVNGHELKRDKLDGYDTWFGSGFTHLKINVPPAKSKRQNLYIITCAYQPDVKREYGWTPPDEVLNALNR
jgi:hypothetical protein